jgi:hypothetical protein
MNKALVIPAVGVCGLLVLAWNEIGRDHSAPSPSPGYGCVEPARQMFTAGDPPRPGITRSELLRSSWGHPTHQSKTTSTTGETEFLHYDGGMVMLRDGVVISVTERR